MYQVVHRNKKAVGLTVALFLGNSASGCPHNKKAIGLTVALSWATQHKVVHSNKKAVGLTVALFLATMHQVVHRNLVSIVLLYYPTHFWEALEDDVLTGFDRISHNHVTKLNGLDSLSKNSMRRSRN